MKDAAVPAIGGSGTAVHHNMPAVPNQLDGESSNMSNVYHNRQKWPACNPVSAKEWGRTGDKVGEATITQSLGFDQETRQQSEGHTMNNILQQRRELTNNLLSRARLVSREEYDLIKAAIENIQHSYKDPKLQLLILKQMQ